MIGLTGIGTYIPEGKKSVDEIASHLDLKTREKIGIKNVLYENKLTATEMAIAASKMAIKEAKLSPLDIDLIVNTQASLQDYLVWQVSAAVQDKLKARNAIFFDMYQGCSGFIAGLITAKRFLETGDGMKSVLVSTSEKWDTTIKQRVLGGYVWGEAGAATLVQKNSPGNFILGHSMICRGELNDVSRMRVGTINPPIESNPKDWYYYDMTNIDKAKKHMIPINIDLFHKVADQAITNSQLSWQDIDYVIFPNIDFGIFDKFLSKFQVERERTNYRYISETGDCSTADALLNYYRMLIDGLLQKGDHVLIVSQGAGVTWSALVIQV